MISIFAKQAFLNTNPHQPFSKDIYHGRGHLMRVSSMIRGDQVAEAIGAKYNPTDGYQNDVCIYVKPHLKRGTTEFTFEGRKAYIDIVDGHALGEILHKYPEVGCITCSRSDEKIMRGELKNEVIYIPQHHCNFENKHRTRKEFTRCGMIGTNDLVKYIPEQEIRERLAERGIELVIFHDFFERQDIIDFYMNIDFQIVWRPYKKILSNPLKLVNGASFGVPTIAYYETAFEEMGGCYIPVTTVDELMVAVDQIQMGDSYNQYSERCIEKAKNYHITKVASMYKELDV